MPNLLDEKRKIESLDKIVIQFIEPRALQSLPSLKRKLKEKKLYLDEDPEDVSIYPRVINKEENRYIQNMCLEISETAFFALADYLENPSQAPTSHLNDYLLSLSSNPRFLVGNARYDFLKEGDQYKLVEMNFVNVGAIIESTESATSILELFPELKSCFKCKSIMKSVKQRLQEQDSKLVLLLTRDDYSKQMTDFSDRIYIVNSLVPIETIIIPERDYSKINFNGATFYNGRKVDAFYIKYLDGTEGKEDALFKQEEFCRNLVSSETLLFDHLTTMLLENKDLRFLTRINPKVQKYLPKIYDLKKLSHLSDFSDFVLKEKDTHCGRGVIISPKYIRGENVIIQERIHTNKFPILTIEGREGNATYDTGVYVSYLYDLKKRKLLKCEAAGYLTRFSQKSDIVNLSQGGGVIPTLVER